MPSFAQGWQDLGLHRAAHEGIFDLRVDNRMNGVSAPYCRPRSFTQAEPADIPRMDEIDDSSHRDCEEHRILH